jgi:hypothetical protein
LQITPSGQSFASEALYKPSYVQIFPLEHGRHSSSSEIALSIYQKPLLQFLHDYNSSERKVPARQVFG